MAVSGWRLGKAREGVVHRETDSADEVLHLVGLDGDRRDEEDRVAQRTDDEAVAARGEGDAIAGACVGRPALRGRRLEFDGAREAELPERAHVGVPGEGRRHLAAEERGALGYLT